MRILIIEDEEPLVEILRKGLRDVGYAVDAALTGEEGLYMAETYAFDAIILDLMLPDADGLTLLEQLRRKGCQTPVLILSARSALEDKVEGFRRGSDDYVTKPFAFAELCARLQAIIRRSHGVTMQVLTVEDLEIDLDRRRVRRGGQEVTLTATLFAILEYLLLKRGRVIPRTELCEHLWSHDWEKTSNVLDKHVSLLRAKIDHGRPERLIETIHAVGFRMRE